MVGGVPEIGSNMNIFRVISLPRQRRPKGYVLHYRICSSNMRRPIPMRINPPTTSALFPSQPPAFFPSRKPVTVTTKAITPIVMQAGKMFTSKKAKLKPIARASMLVATERTRSKNPLVMSLFLRWPSLLRNDSQIIRLPTRDRSTKASQWS